MTKELAQIHEKLDKLIDLTADTSAAMKVMKAEQISCMKAREFRELEFRKHIDESNGLRLQIHDNSTFRKSAKMYMRGITLTVVGIIGKLIFWK